ncbi:MAG: 3'-5' exonuclease, partial [Propionibacteriaceae bacterium]|nr:3'-5' exonuclease [Propionibacteriaceae bacterium]
TPKPEDPGLADGLDWLLAGTDPSERLCLFDALLDPGEARLSEAGRQRIGAFAAEFTALQRHAHDPVPDVVRRVVATLGLEVEIAVHAARRRHDAAAQLSRFLDAVADYVELDADATLGGLLAYFEAELSHGEGLEQATPSEQNSVKVLTVHKAKGLEWDRVYLPNLADRVFPSDRSGDNHLRQAAAIPAPLRGDAGSIPQLRDISDAGIKAYGQELSAEQQLAEDRLAYVAVTRARTFLAASWHVWDPGAARPRQPSRYFRAVREVAARQGGVLAEAPPPGEHNPIDPADSVAVWPHPLDEALAAERRRAAGWVAQARLQPFADEPMSAQAASLVATWDEDLEVLLAQVRESDRGVVEVQVPESLSVTSLTRLREDPQAWAAQEVRPMPRPPSRGAQLGSRFHAWVQRRHEVTGFFDDEEHQIESDEALGRLVEAFERGPYAHRTPFAVEVPFVLRLGRHVVRGRIDAVYRDAGGDQVVDWKTSDRDADPRQLAYYRLAWARATGQPPESVDAVFYHVPSGEVRRAEGLDGEEALVAFLGER